ncbi:MAG: CHAT domain-containing protein [Chloroflexota bacterium]|nr:MAG: CHAT domain-containing protein [Chloroflexota bacterium]
MNHDMPVTLSPADYLPHAIGFTSRPIALLVGSALSRSPDGRRGVPGVDAMVDLVHAEASTPALRQRLDRLLDGKLGTERYQIAMGWLSATRGPQGVRRVVASAVARARRLPFAGPPEQETSDGDPAEWEIPTACQQLARFVVSGAGRVGPVLTTNFDPLVSLAIRAAGGQLKRTVLAADGRLPSPVEAEDGVHDVVHLHGYWRADTLHTPAQLATSRPHLTAALRRLLDDHALLVVGYGGWDDVFATALSQLMMDDDARVDVLWAFHETDFAQVEARHQSLLDRVQPAIIRGRFRAYGGVDCHSQFGTLPLPSPGPPSTTPLFPALTLRIDRASNPTQWTIDSSLDGARTCDVPWRREPGLAAALDGFWKLSQRPVERDAERATVHAHAIVLGKALALVLSDRETSALEDLARGDGPPPFLVVESQDDMILALPWELLYLDDRFAVADARLDVARCVPTPGAPVLDPPKEYLRLLVNVSAPDGSRLDYEAESYRITRALHEHAGVFVNEMGETDDLVAGLQREPAPLGVHFSGHGGPGTLTFENAYGDPDEVPVAKLLDEIRRAAPRRIPRFFYLASCHGNTSPVLAGTTGPADEQPGATASASQLHREGVAQVVAYFGPVYDAASTRAAEALYRSLGQGRTTRDAIRAARAALARPFDPGVGDVLRIPRPEAAREGATPFAWAQLVLYHRGPDHPLSLPIPVRYPEELEARPARHFESAGPTRRVLQTGFIGRRRELHELRRRIRDGRQIHVVQGLGGLGKSTLCIEALKLYAHRRRVVLWCSEVENDVRPAPALARQLLETLAATFGSQWYAVAAEVDRLPDLTPARQITEYLRAVQSHAGSVPLVLYLDNLDSLLHHPETANAESAGEWRDGETRELWHALLALSAEYRGSVAIVASCRYRHDDFADHVLPLGRLSDDALFRLTAWFPGLRRLAAQNRERLVTRMSGHPRAVEWLDKLVQKSLLEWEQRCGEWPVPRDDASSQREWEQIVAPALPPVDQQLTQDLLLDALWAHILDQPARRMLLRLTVLRRPWDWALMAALGDPGASDPERDHSIHALLGRAGLLTEIRERHSGNGETRLFELHPTVVRFAIAKASDADRLRSEAFGLAGQSMEQRARVSSDLRDDLDAGHYLFNAGEHDRAFDLLAGAAEALQTRGRNTDSLAVLDPMLDARAQIGLRLSEQNLARLYAVAAQAHVGVGRLDAARQALATAIERFLLLTARDPTNSEWQRDLSVSHIRIGAVLLAQGDAPGALAAFRAALAIRERLAQQDPTNSQWQRDLQAVRRRIAHLQGDGPST